MIRSAEHMSLFAKFGRYTKADRQKLLDGNWLSLVEKNGLIYLTAWHDGTFGCSKHLAFFIDELADLVRMIELTQETLEIPNEHVVMLESVYKKLRRQEVAEVAKE